METPQLASLAHKSRSTREAGIALILGSLVLGVFFFVPLQPEATPQTEAAEVQEIPNAFATVTLTAKAAIVYDLVTGENLFALNADTQLPLASLTKLLTVQTALTVLSPDTPITISAEDASLPSPRRFAAGDILSLSDLAKLTLTASLNDGASAIASAAASRLATSTTALMAGAAAALGLTETYALNGSGLDVSHMISGAYGSARDVAMLAGALVDMAPEIALATTLTRASAQTASGKTYEISNTNPTVDYAPRLLLSKTGFTDLAGGNLAIVFDAGINHPIAVVVLNSTESARFTDAQSLVAATLAHFASLPSL